MGAVVFWTLVRLIILIPFLWILENYIPYQYWWSFCILAICGIIIHPAIVQYRLFEEENKEIVDNTLCSTCNFFDKTAVICLKHDKHPSRTELPCEGLDWEPINSDNNYAEKENE